MVCRSCRSTNIQDILSLGEQYLSDFIDPDEKKSHPYPLNLVMCKDCTLVQLKETTPSEVLYTDHYGYRSGINNTIRADLEEIVQRVYQKIHLQERDIVVDIGANDGTLLSFFLNVHRVAFEPVSKFAKEILENKKAELVINNYFSAKEYNKYFYDRAMVVTAISMFYDLDDPNSFVKDVADILDPKGIFIIQQNYLLGMLKNHAFDNIVHEHLEYYSLTSLEKLLNRHGLEVVDVETNFINGGSFRTYVQHMDNIKKMRYMEKKVKLDNQWTYMLFALEVKRAKEKLYTFIRDIVDKGKTVYLLGASTRGNTLLQFCGLNNKLIKAAMERNPEKWGKKMMSTDIPIISEEQARKDKPDYMLVCPWFFRDEIVKREKDYLKSGGHLIFPLPKFEIV